MTARTGCNGKVRESVTWLNNTLSPASTQPGQQTPTPVTTPTGYRSNGTFALVPELFAVPVAFGVRFDLDVALDLGAAGES